MSRSKNFAMFSTAFLASTSAISLSTPVWAQDSQALNQGVQDIVVTARRQSESLQDVPMSVDVTTGDQLQKLSLFDAKDIQQLAPGLELTNNNGRSNTTTLRGITFDPDQGTAPAVRVYLNEVPTDAQTVYTALYDVQQIEVLRGPQGTLRGLPSPAGAITITTRRPSFDEIVGFAQATATDDNAYNVQGGVSLPFSDKFAIRLAALVDGNQVNQVYNVNRGERSRSRTESARVTAGWKPSEDFTAYLTYQYLEADNRQAQQVVGEGNAPSLVFGDPTRTGPTASVQDYIAVSEGQTRYKNMTHILNLQADWDLGTAILSFVGAHQFSKLDQLRDLDPANAVPNYFSNSHTISPYKVDTAELRLASNHNEVWNWTVSAFYTKQTGDVRVTQGADSFFAPAPISAGLFLPIDVSIAIPVYSRTLSFNASSSVELGRFTIEGGIRYSRIKSVQTALVTATSPGYPAFGIPPFVSTVDGVPADLAVSKDNPFTGGATISYKATDDINLYAAYGHSFRAGSAGVAAPAGISDDLILTKPEKTDSYEVGVKASFFDRRMSISVAGFYQKFDGYLGRFNDIYYNCQDMFGTCSPSGPAINNGTDVPRTNGLFNFNYNGDATIKGVEATVEGRPLDNWDVSVSAAYIKGRYDDAALPCNDFDGDGKPDGTGTPVITGSGNVSFCKTNSRLADIPDFTLSANSELRFPMDTVTPFVRGLLSYRPGVFSERADFRYQSRALLNAYVGVRTNDGRWEVNVFAKNLLNQKRITNISLGNAQQATAAGPYDSGYRMVSATNPREVGLTTTFNF